MTGTISIPSYEQVVALPRELGPITVPEAYRDENDHMNVTHYFALCVSAATGVFERAGITDEYRATRGTGFFTGEHHIRYYSENRIGEQISVHVRGVDRSDKVVHAMALLVNDSTRRLSCTLELIAVHVDLNSRTAERPRRSPPIPRPPSTGNSPPPRWTGRRRSVAPCESGANSGPDRRPERYRVARRRPPAGPSPPRARGAGQC